MSFKHTACLAALLMASPAICQTAWGADYDNTTNPSDNTVTLNSGYDNVYVGHNKSSALTGTVSANKNIGIMANGLKTQDLFGGWSELELSADNQTLNLVLEANNNELTLQSGSEVTKRVIGGYIYCPSAPSNIKNDSTIEFKANYNTVTVEEGAVADVIYGAEVELFSSWASANTQASALHNTVNVKAVCSEDGFTEIAGGIAKGPNALAQDNTVAITGSGLYSAVGGSANTSTENGKAVALKNTVTIENTCDVYGLVGGIAGINNYKGSSAVAENNVVTVHNADGTEAQFVVGGYSGQGIDDISDESVTGLSAVANSNKVILYGGKYNCAVYGGFARVGGSGGTTEASNNEIVLMHGSDGIAPYLAESVLFGGYAKSNVNTDGTGGQDGKSEGNKLTFCDVRDVQAGNIKNFQALNYEYAELHAGETILKLSGLEKTWEFPDPVYGQSTSLANAAVTVSVGNLYGENNGEFKVGDKVVLLTNGNGIDTTNMTTKATITAETGISLTYEVDILSNDTELYLTRTGTKTGVLPGTKAIAEGAAAGSALINAGSDAVIAALGNMSSIMNNAEAGSDFSPSSLPSSLPSSGTGYNSASSSSSASSGSDFAGRDGRDFSGGDGAGRDNYGRDAYGKDSAGKNSADKDNNGKGEGNDRGRARDEGDRYGNIFAFGYAQGASVRHETGSHINVSSVSLVAGLGKGFKTGAGNLGVGAFFEYGKGSYTTNNSFDNRSDIDGDGNSWYMGGGLMARLDFVPTGPGHFYAEGSAHMGTLHNEYDSNDLVDSNGNVAKFDMDSPYYSLHGGLGYVWNFAEGHDLDVYGKYIWTRVQGTDDTLTTKDKFEYDDIDSNRVRFGVRYSYKGSERFSPYVGVAFEHEFSGDCESSAFGHPVAAPSFKGSSGMGELGLVMRPTVSVPLSLNLGVQGYVGQKQGVSGNCTIMYEF